jgi:hypothetical protein
MLVLIFFLQARNPVVSGKGSVGGGEAGEKTKTTPDVGGKSVSEKPQATSTCRNPFEKSKSKQTEFFVRKVKDKRMTKNGPEFLITSVA